jgi:hypothetical protein
MLPHAPAPLEMSRIAPGVQPAHSCLQNKLIPVTTRAAHAPIQFA